MIKMLCLLSLLISSWSLKASLQPQFIRYLSLSEWEQADKGKERNSFLKILCKKQLSLQKIPTACFSLPEKKKQAENFCMKLNLKSFTELYLEKTLKNKDISKKCQVHLKSYFFLLRYRKRDLSLFIKKQ